MKALSVTLYDVFGYLIPGLLTLTALLIFYWTAFHTTPFTVGSPPISVWILVGLSAYLLGHLTQAIANHVVALFPSTVELVLNRKNPSSLSDPVVARLNTCACEMLGTSKETELSASILWDICDHYTVQQCETEIRDLYVYREGFYRGLMIAMALLSAACLLRATVGSSELRFDDLAISMSAPALITLGLASGGSAYLFFGRFRRFGRYLVKFSVLSFLVRQGIAESE